MTKYCQWCKKEKSKWYLTRWGGYGVSLCEQCYKSNQDSKFPYHGPKIRISES